MTQAFNLSQFANKVNTSGQADLTTAVTGTLPQANGGTGTTTAANGELLIGNGSGFTKATITQGSGITVTNASGAITIAASGGGQLQTQLFTSPGTWTKPSSTTQVRVLVVGGGGGVGTGGPGGGAGGLAWAMVPVSAPVSITVGSGGAAYSGSGGTSSFGSAVSATGGTSAPGTPGSPGSGTVSTGTALKTGSIVGPTSSTGTNSIFTVGILNGTARSSSGPSPTAYSTSGSFIAGAGGIAPGDNAGIGGAVVVEFVG